MATKKKTAKKAPAKKAPAAKQLSADQKKRLQKWVNEGRSQFAQQHAARILGDAGKASKAIYAMQAG